MWLNGGYKRHPSFLLAGGALTPAWSIWGKVGGMNSAKNCEKLVWNMWPWTDSCRNQTANYVIVYKHSLHKALCCVFWTCTLLIYKIIWTLLDTDIEFSLWGSLLFFFNFIWIKKQLLVQNTCCSAVCYRNRQTSLQRVTSVSVICRCSCRAVAYPGILFEGGSTNSVEDREQRTGIWGQ
jgi:hypothetical protein